MHRWRSHVWPPRQICGTALGCGAWPRCMHQRSSGGSGAASRQAGAHARGLEFVMRHPRAFHACSCMGVSCLTLISLRARTTEPTTTVHPCEPPAHCPSALLRWAGQAAATATAATATAAASRRQWQQRRRCHRRRPGPRCTRTGEHASLPILHTSCTLRAAAAHATVGERGA